ncbi:hypothetical protein BT93_J0274 [Corymbia citriodora subsp. variegata]|nr:hypothetical protein BT93_J0274 [Corymbia citriodora subsp. variegata]
MSSSASVSSRPSDSGARTLLGSLFVAAGCVCFVAFAYAAVASKLLTPSDNAVVAAVRDDRLSIWQGVLSAFTLSSSSWSMIY